MLAHLAGVARQSTSSPTCPPTVWAGVSFLVVALRQRWWHVGDDLATDVAAASRVGMRMGLGVLK